MYDPAWLKKPNYHESWSGKIQRKSCQVAIYQPWPDNSWLTGDDLHKDKTPTESKMR
jgi:hypothetical protein